MIPISAYESVKLHWGQKVSIHLNWLHLNGRFTSNSNISVKNGVKAIKLGFF